MKVLIGEKKSVQAGIPRLRLGFFVTCMHLLKHILHNVLILVRIQLPVAHLARPCSTMLSIVYVSYRNRTGERFSRSGLERRRDAAS